MRLEKIQILFMSEAVERRAGRGNTARGTYIVVNAEIDLLAAFLLLFDEAGSKASTASIDNVAALFSFDRGMEAEVLATSQAKAPELFLVAQLLGAVLHEGL